MLISNRAAGATRRNLIYGRLAWLYFHRRILARSRPFFGALTRERRNERRPTEPALELKAAWAYELRRRQRRLLSLSRRCCHFKVRLQLATCSSYKQRAIVASPTRRLFWGVRGYVFRGDGPQFGGVRGYVFLGQLKCVVPTLLKKWGPDDTLICSKDWVSVRRRLKT